MTLGRIAAFLWVVIAAGCRFDSSGLASSESIDGGQPPDGIGAPDGGVSADAGPGGVVDAAPPPPVATPDASPPDADTDGCGAGQRRCDGQCRDVTSDPNRCGGCDVVCAPDQYCVASACACRPGLVDDGAGGCIDPSSNPDACGAGKIDCQGGSPNCQGGQCTDGCSMSHDECGLACVETDTDPMHCGGCNRTCDSDEVCRNGSCARYLPAPQCDSCPCGRCNEDFRCQAYPGDPDQIICVFDNGDDDDD